jgi:hypothetical protein
MAASSSIVRSNFDETLGVSVLCSASRNLSADFSISFGFYFHACESCLQMLPNPGRP